MDYKKEVRRAFFHMALGVAIVVLALLIDYAILISGMLVVLGLGLIVSDISRTKKLPVIDWFLRTFERPKEYKTFPGKGAFYFIAGSLLALVLFEKNTALAAILILAFGDGSAKIFGKFGKIKTPLNGKKTLEGTVMGIFLGSLSAMVFVAPAAAFFGALLGMIAEMIDFENFQINDNILVPLVSGLAVSVVSSALV